MRLLLIKPLYRFKSYHPVQFTGAEKALPLSLAYLAAVLEKDGHTLKVVDYQIETPPIAQVVTEFRPDVVGLSVYSKEYGHALELMRAIKTVSKRLPIVMGGPHVNAYRQRLFEQTRLPDYLVLQEGEVTFLELVKSLQNNADPATVLGIALRVGDHDTRITPRRPFIKNLDRLPFMALQHFAVDRYYPGAGTFRRLPSVTMITSRGCPHGCIFCNTDLFGKNVRLRSAENVLAEVEEIVGKYRVKEINFCDETFTINRQRVVDICEGLIERKLNLGWKCSTRVDQVDPQLLGLMKRAGCFYIGYGVESGVQRILDRLQKGITLEQIRCAFAATRQAGITSMAYFMMNVPSETRSDIEASIRFSREIKPDFLNFELIKPYCGTPLRDMIESDPNITINAQIWEKWESYSAGNHLFYVQQGVSEVFLADAYRRAVKRFYLRPGFIINALLTLRSFAQFKSYLRAFLNMIKIRLVKSEPESSPKRMPTGWSDPKKQ